MTQVHIHIHRGHDSRKRAVDIALDRGDVGRTAWLRDGSNGRVLAVDEAKHKAQLELYKGGERIKMWVDFREIESL
jgi:hypothetical protein